MILNLKWHPSAHSGWIDLEAGIMYREGTAERRTKKRKPPVKLSRKLLCHLRRWHRQDGLTDGYVVHLRGERIECVRKGWNGARVVAGLEERFTPHTLRHTRATWLMRAGVDLWDAAGSLGMTVQQLENGYGHHHPDMQKGSADAY